MPPKESGKLLKLDIIDYHWKRIKQSCELYNDVNIMRNKFYFETIDELSNKLCCIQSKLKEKTSQSIKLIRENK